MKNLWKLLKKKSYIRLSSKSYKIKLSKNMILFDYKFYLSFIYMLDIWF